jgi:hypothetical protein
MALPGWLNEETRTRITAIFRRGGVHTTIWIAKELDPTEVVFVVEGGGGLSESSLAQELTTELDRKVWITSMSDVWKDRVDLLQDAE